MSTELFLNYIFPEYFIPEIFVKDNFSYEDKPGRYKAGQKLYFL